MTARVLIALTQVFQVDAGAFDVGDEGRLAADLREATVDAAAYGDPPSAAEIKQAASATPALARQFLALHRAFRRLDERFKAMDETVSLDETATVSASLPYEEVRDFFHYKDNYLDDAGHRRRSPGLPHPDRKGADAGGGAGPGAARPARRHGGAHVGAWRGSAPIRSRRRAGYMSMAPSRPPTRTFQLAHQLALLEFRDLIELELERARFRSPAARDVCRIGLGNYAAGALILPYRAFLEAAACPAPRR